jgi:hypothetical protein
MRDITLDEVEQVAGGTYILITMGGRTLYDSYAFCY